MIKQGDCLDVLKPVEDKLFDLIILDPPYNIGIDTWDKIDNYNEWMTQVFKTCERVLKDNGTMWLFHNSFPTVSELHQVLVSETKFNFKQFITINKGLQSIAGRASDSLRSYPRATEYILFYTFQDGTGLNTINKNLGLFKPVKDYMFTEGSRWEATPEKLASLLNRTTLPGMYPHYFCNCTQWSLPTKPVYEKLQSTGYFQKPYEELRQEYEELRYTFKMERGVTDVWDIDFYKDRVPWHPTNKPYQLIKRVIETATNEGDMVLDPFSGSGTTALVCRDLKRQYTCIELNENYVEKSERRLRETPISLTSYDSCD